MKSMNEAVRKDMMDYGIAENMNRTLLKKKKKVGLTKLALDKMG